MTLRHSCKAFAAGEIAMTVPLGHQLSRVRVRHLAQSERITVAIGGCPAGLAAFKKAASEVRVVHEFLVSRRLDGEATEAVANVMLSSLELLSCEDGVHCLMILLGPEIPFVLFEQHAYAIVGTDSDGAWLQKRLDTPLWIATASHSLH